MKKAEIIWKFNTEAKLEAACNIPGHYETGMIEFTNCSMPWACCSCNILPLYRLKLNILIL